jgi:MFS family permease
MIGILPLFVVFIESELRAGPFEFGLFTAAASLGYVLASYLAVKVERKVSPFVLLVWGSALSGLFLIPFPFVHSFYLLLLLRFLSALTYGSGNLVANIQIAQSSPSDVRGRVNSTSWSLIKSAQVISSLGLGFAATEFSASRIVASSGLLLFTGSVLAVLLAGQTVKRSLTTAI